MNMGRSDQMRGRLVRSVAIVALVGCGTFGFSAPTQAFFGLDNPLGGAATGDNITAFNTQGYDNNWDQWLDHDPRVPLIDLNDTGTTGACMAQIQYNNVTAITLPTSINRARPLCLPSDAAISSRRVFSNALYDSLGMRKLASSASIVSAPVIGGASSFRKSYSCLSKVLDSLYTSIEFSSAASVICIPRCSSRCCLNCSTWRVWR